MMCSEYRLNKQGDSRQPCCTPFLVLNQSVASWPAYRFLRRPERLSGIPISFRAFQSLLWRRKWCPTQYSCLENPMDREAWLFTVHGTAESRTLLNVQTRFVMIHTVKCFNNNGSFINNCVILSKSPYFFTLGTLYIKYRCWWWFYCIANLLIWLELPWWLRG